jgi:hypothetical protein
MLMIVEEETYTDICTVTVVENRNVFLRKIYLFSHVKKIDPSMVGNSDNDSST